MDTVFCYFALSITPILRDMVYSQTLPSAVVWVFVLTLPLPRLVAVGVAIYLIALPRGQLQPTVLAKVFLAMATVLSIMEDIPNSVTTAAPSHIGRYASPSDSIDPSV